MTDTKEVATSAPVKNYTYDQNGNMTGWTSQTSGQNRTIVWNEENRVKSIADSGSTTVFLYDDAGERAVKRGQHGESVYINRFYAVKNGDLGSKHIFAGETRVVTKLEKDGGSIQSGVPGSVALVRSQGIQNAILQGSGQKKGINRRLTPSDGSGGTTTTTNPPIEKFEFFYHGDHLGSSSFITDDAGAVYQHLEYFPYGESWVEDGGSGQMPYYRFTGKELDPETGLYYYGARYYDPVLSRWISADPALESFIPSVKNKINTKTLSNFEKFDRIGFKRRSQLIASEGMRLVTFLNAYSGEELPRIYDPIVLSEYSYVENNPVRYVDPFGFDKERSLFGEFLDIFEIKSGIGAGLEGKVKLGLLKGKLGAEAVVETKFEGAQGKLVAEGSAGFSFGIPRVGEVGLAISAESEYGNTAEGFFFDSPRAKPLDITLGFKRGDIVAEPYKVGAEATIPVLGPLSLKGGFYINLSEFVDFIEKAHEKSGRANW